jgi:hypothetical protein
MANAVRELILEPGVLDYGHRYVFAVTASSLDQDITLTSSVTLLMLRTEMVVLIDPLIGMLWPYYHRSQQLYLSSDSTDVDFGSEPDSTWTCEIMYYYGSITPLCNTTSVELSSSSLTLPVSFFDASSLAGRTFQFTLTYATLDWGR